MNAKAQKREPGQADESKATSPEYEALASSVSDMSNEELMELMIMVEETREKRRLASERQRMLAGPMLATLEEFLRHSIDASDYIEASTGSAQKDQTVIFRIDRESQEILEQLARRFGCVKGKTSDVPDVNGFTRLLVTNLIEACALWPGVEDAFEHARADVEGPNRKDGQNQ